MGESLLMTLSAIDVTLFITFTHCQSAKGICTISPGVMKLEIIVEGRKTKVDMGKKIKPTGTLLSKQPSKYLSSL
jgi:hypothetical protein